MVSVKVNEERLTDGSKAYNLVLTQRMGRELAACLYGDGCPVEDRTETIELPANSERDANELAEAIARLIARHTAEQVTRL